MLQSIGIIGYGRFGKLISDLFREYSPDILCTVYSRSHTIDNSIFFPLEEVCHADIVIPCCPIRNLEETLYTIKPLLKSTSTLIDICSVKIFPAQWIQTILPDQPYICTHPMFGPEGSKNGTELAGLKLMMWNISGKQEIYDWYKKFWEDRSVNVVEMTPEEHDRYSAYSMNYNHLLGRLHENLGMQPTPIDTLGFDTLHNALHYLTGNSYELFIDMQRYNPYSKAMREEVLASLKALCQELDTYDIQK